MCQHLGQELASRFRQRVDQRLEKMDEKLDVMGGKLDLLVQAANKEAQKPPWQWGSVLTLILKPDRHGETNVWPDFALQEQCRPEVSALRGLSSSHEALWNGEASDFDELTDFACKERSYVLHVAGGSILGDDLSEIIEILSMIRNGPESYMKLVVLNIPNSQALAEACLYDDVRLPEVYAIVYWTGEPSIAEREKFARGFHTKLLNKLAIACPGELCQGALTDSFCQGQISLTYYRSVDAFPKTDATPHIEFREVRHDTGLHLSENNNPAASGGEEGGDPQSPSQSMPRTQTHNQTQEHKMSSNSDSKQQQDSASPSPPNETAGWPMLLPVQGWGNPAQVLAEVSEVLEVAKHLAPFAEGAKVRLKVEWVAGDLDELTDILQGKTVHDVLDGLGLLLGVSVHSVGLQQGSVVLRIDASLAHAQRLLHLVGRKRDKLIRRILEHDTKLHVESLLLDAPSMEEAFSLEGWLCTVFIMELIQVSALHKDLSRVHSEEGIHGTMDILRHLQQKREDETGKSQRDGDLVRDFQQRLHQRLDRLQKLTKEELRATLPTTHRGEGS
eukprot:TRINITY_DN3360_c0_g1_i4.p1 TRINITY_DN3360_c0_g1~~TRINITY_DN3360_c0_g1_i4.p1  ORF type:complete len:560 (+),score=37.19 TRINITY_DN3360_c0_g1_i4:739-2418(+)